MQRRFLIALFLLGKCVCSGHAAQAVDAYLQLFPLSGETQLRNKDASPLMFDFISIRSDGGTLNSSPTVWNSISGTYDASGNGFIDAANNWVKVSSVATELTEGVFTGPGGTLAANRAISLGNIWNSAPPLDLVAELQSNGQPLNVVLEYALTGDYFRDGVVNQLDYDLWRQDFGSTANLDADGNLDGVVDAADFVLWRYNLGTSIPSLSIGSGASGGASLGVDFAVPEPVGAVLVALAICFLALWMNRRTATRFAAVWSRPCFGRR